MEPNIIESKFILTGIATIIGALIMFFGNKFIESKKQKVIETKLKRTLFYELLHILQHYSYVKKDIIVREFDINQQWEIKKDLMYSQYGKFLSATKFDEYGFLTETEIKNLLVLSFRIRNTDNLIKLILDDNREITSLLLKEFKERKNFIYHSADNILTVMIKENTEYRKIYNKLVKEPRNT